MSEMKNSGIEWMGNIPNLWDVKRVKHGFYRKKAEAHQDNPIVLSLARAGVRERDISNNEGQIAESYYNYNPVDIDDLLINPMDLYSGANCSISKTEGVISQAYINLRYKNGYYPRYYDYYFKIQYWMMAFFAHGKGVSFDNRWTLNAETLMNYPIIVPPIEDQKKIADYLDSKCSQIDAIIAKQEQIIEKLKEYKLSLITETVTKGLNSNVEMKDSGIDWIGVIPSTWEVVPLKKKLSSIVDYRGKTPEKVSEGVFLVTAKNIKNGSIDYDVSQEYVKHSDYDDIMHRGLPNIGDVLFTTEAPLGQVANVDRTDIALAQRIIKFSAGEDLNPYFLKYWIMSSGFQHFLASLSTGSTAAGIKASKLFLLPLVLPTKCEQDKIVIRLDNKCKLIDKEIIERQLEIEKLIDFKKSLVFEVVTGKKEV